MDRARLLERTLDDRQADLRLLVGRRRRVGVARHDRRGSRDPDAGRPRAPRASSRRVPRTRRRTRSAAAPSLASLAVRGRAAPGRGVALRARCSRRHRRCRGSVGDGTGGSRGRRSRSSRPPSRCSSPRRRGSSTSTSPRARRDRPFAICSRTRRACRSTMARRSRGPARGGSTRTTGSRSRPPSSPSGRACRSRSTSRTCGRARRRCPRGLGGLGRRGNARRPARARPRAARADADRAGDARGSVRRCNSPGSSACCRASAGRSRTTGGSGSSCATRSLRTGRAQATRRATFGHFGRSGTFLWVDPDASIALGVPHRSRVRRLGGRRVAAPVRGRPVLSGTRSSKRVQLVRPVERRRGGRRPERRRAPSPGICSARCCAIARKSGLVVLADDHERRDRERLESGASSGHMHLRLLVRRSAARLRGVAAAAPRRGAPA